VIARALFVSEATVKTHLLHAFGKLGVHGRTAAVTRALELGLVRVDAP
jgi:DNA-binding NarL/FixJ family response regulator